MSIDFKKEKTSESVPRFLSLSPREWSLILLGIIGITLLQLVFPEKGWKIYICSLGLSFIFETSMEPLFTYHIQLREKHCIAKTDLNFLFPLGWSSVVGFTTLVAEKLIIPYLSLPLIVSYMLAGFVVGNIHEFFFYKLKYWIYNYDAPMIGSWKPFIPKITFFEIPIQVILGYAFIVGATIYFINNIMF